MDFISFSQKGFCKATSLLLRYPWKVPGIEILVCSLKKKRCNLMEENDEYIIEQHRMYKQFEEARRQASVQPQPMLVEIKDGLESEDDQYLRAQEESLRYWEAKKNGTYHEPILIDEGDGMHNH